MSELGERLRERGWRMTSQRRVIADVFVGNHVHLTADEVHERARGVLPELSIATVYNTLNELVDMGELQELLHRDLKKRYDPNTTVDHHHLVCEACGTMLDVQLDDEPTLSGDDQNGYDLQGFDVFFRGNCPTCIAGIPTRRM